MYEKQNEEFSKWWDDQVLDSNRWTTLERIAAQNAWMEAHKRAFCNHSERAEGCPTSSLNNGLELQNNFKIQVVKNEGIDAFGAYVSPSIKKNDFGVVLFNLEACLITSIEEKDISFKEMFIETIMHEIGHALEEFYDLEFDEDRIERIAESYRYSTENES
jgi:hypothetical protein